MSDPTELTGVELLRAGTSMMADHPNIGRYLGMEVVTIQEGRVEFALTTNPELSNPLGNLHGGICATLLDSVMGCAVHSTLAAGVGYSTLELKVNYIATVSTDSKRLVATGTTIHLGRTTATAEGKVYDEDGRLVAHGTTTCLIHR